MQKLLSPQKRRIESRFEEQVMMYFRIILIFGVMFVGIAYLAGAQEDAQDDIVAEHGAASAAANISATGLQETQDLTEKSGTVSGVVVAALVITILLSAFFGVFALTKQNQ